jgi:hypothetical protein
MSAERQARTLIRAWPCPDRTERGDEIVGTTLDLLPDGATRLPVALAMNLLVGGLQTRWRMRPPVWRWAYYRLGGRLTNRWHQWVLNDLTSPGWRRRMVISQMFIVSILVVAGLTAAQAVSHQHILSTLGLVPVLAGGGAGVLTRSSRDRERQLVRHGYAWPSSNDPPWPPPVSSESSSPLHPGVAGPH